MDRVFFLDEKTLFIKKVPLPEVPLPVINSITVASSSAAWNWKTLPGTGKLEAKLENIKKNGKKSHTSKNYLGIMED